MSEFKSRALSSLLDKQQWNYVINSTEKNLASTTGWTNRRRAGSPARNGYGRNSDSTTLIQPCSLATGLPFSQRRSIFSAIIAQTS